MFYYGIYTANEDTGNMFGFTTNNGEVDNNVDGGNFFSQSTGTNDRIQNAIWIGSLASGDTVWVAARGASDFYSGHSYWGGCRLK